MSAATDQDQDIIAGRTPSACPQVMKLPADSGDLYDKREVALESTKFPDEIIVDEILAFKGMNPTLKECIQHCPKMIFSAMVASFGGVLFGYDTAAINGILIMPSFLETMGGAILSPSELANLLSWITSSLLLGAFIAAPFAGPLADTFGRKICINLSCLIICIGAAIQAASFNPGTMIAGRVIVGAAIGLLSACVPIYIAEVSAKSLRGSLSSSFQVTIAFGILLAFLVTLGFNTYSAAPDGTYFPNNWRYILGIQAVLAIVLAVFMIPLPETPRWLLSNNLIDDAKKVLAQTRWRRTVGRFKNEEGDYEEITNIDLEVDDIAEEVNNCRTNRSWYNFSDLLSPNNLLRTSIGVIIKFLQQLTGINAIFYYSSIIFQDLGIQPDTTTAATGAVSLIATFIAVFLIDVIGRRPLLISGSNGMMVSLLIVGALIYSTGYAHVSNSIAVFIMIFIANFAYSYGPIAWLYPAEIFPVDLRAQGVSISTSSDWLANFAVTKALPGMVLKGSNVGGLGGTFIFFGAWCFVMTIWGVTNIHETMNLTLEHMNNIFDVSTWNEYYHYVWMNTKYFFYCGDKTMYEYTHGDQEVILCDNDLHHTVANTQKRLRSPTLVINNAEKRNHSAGMPGENNDSETDIA